MSTVKTTNLQHPSASDVGITLGADGSVVLPQGFTGGVGSNVVSTASTTQFATTSTSFVAVTDLDAVITPSSATSKVLVIASIAMAFDDAANTDRTAQTTVFRGATNLSSTDQFLSMGEVTGQFATTHCVIVFLDSPASASATTYEIHVRRGGAGGTVYINSGRNTSGNPAESTITLIEVAA